MKYMKRKKCERRKEQKALPTREKEQRKRKDRIKGRKKRRQKRKGRDIFYIHTSYPSTNGLNVALG
jgi:hypothetical protein